MNQEIPQTLHWFTQLVSPIQMTWNSICDLYPLALKPLLAHAWGLTPVKICYLSITLGQAG